MSEMQQKPRYRWNPKKKKRFIITLVLIILAAAVVGVYAISNMRVTNISDEEADLTFLIKEDSEYAHLYQDSNKINILLVGINTNLTDMIMLVNYDKKTQEMHVISIPRDTYYVRDPNHSNANKKINAAYKGKVANTAEAVSDLLCDIPINYYVVLEHDAVAKIVDAMGGVPMDVPFHMYRNDEWDTPPLHIDIPAGYQVLDGENAVKFLRFRHGDPGYPGYPMEDLDRVKAQQEFIKSAIKESIGLDMLKIAKIAYNEVKCNMTIGNVVSLVSSAKGITTDTVHSYTLPGTVQEVSPYFYYPDKEKIEELISNIYAPQEDESTDKIEEE